MKGKLIVLEGTDSSGKTTQLNKILERLEKENKDFVHMHFPKHDVLFGKVVDSYLMGDFGKKEELSPEFVAMLYLTDFYNSKKLIEDTLNQGKHVVLSRFFSSTLSYQTALAKDDDKEATWQWILDVSKRLPKPDLILVLTLNPALTSKLIENDSDTNNENYKRGKKKDQHEDDLDFQKRVFSEYQRNIIRLNWTQINCIKDEKLLSIDEVHNLIWEKVKAVLE